MKKLLVLFTGLILAFGLMSCGGDSFVPDYEEFESQVAMPVNLEVNDSTKVLSWDDVENASGYSVYVNGEKESDVDGTSYDFSGLSGEVIMFNLVANGPKGYADSQMSGSVAYVADRDNEIRLMATELSNTDMYFSDQDAFAEALVNKGMLADDFEGMVSNVETLEDVESMESFTDMFNSVDGVMDNMDLEEIEAFIYATLTAEALPMLKFDIEENKEYYPEDSPYILQKQAFIDFLEENGDQAVKSIMVVVEYIMDVESAMTDAMVSDIDGMVDDLEDGQVDASVFVSLKDDLVNNMLENLPEVDDVVLFNRTLMTLSNMVSGQEISFMDDKVIAKSSAQMLMSAELYFNFLLMVDEDYVQAGIDLSMTPTLTSRQKTFVKENIDLISEFMDEQEDFMEQMDDLFTEQEKEEIFYDMMLMMQGSGFNSMINPMFMLMMGSYGVPVDSDDMESIIKENIDYSDVLVIQEEMDANFKDLLEAIIESDYAIVDSIFDLVEYEMNASSYSEYNDFVVDIMKDALDLINPLVQDMDSEAFDAYVSYFIGTIIVQLESQKLMHEDDASEIDDVILIFTHIEEGLVSVNDDVLEIIQAVVELATTTDHLENISNSSETYSQYAETIILANAVNDLEADVSSQIDDIISELSSQLQDEDLMDALDLTSSDVSDLIDNINDSIDVFFEYADRIKGYDHANLTEGQMQDIEKFIRAFDFEYVG